MEGILNRIKKNYGEERTGVPGSQERICQAQAGEALEGCPKGPLTVRGESCHWLLRPLVRIGLLRLPRKPWRALLEMLQYEINGRPEDAEEAGYV